MYKMHELKASMVAVDSATPEECYNLICFLYWKLNLVSLKVMIDLHVPLAITCLCIYWQ